MITMNELVDLRMQQHIAHEIYRQQIMQRIPDPFPPMMPIPMPRHVIMPPRVTLPGVEVSLQNDDLWKQFHQIGTEMIITKSGRRMFPSMRLALSGLDEDANYCVLLEMVPIGDCRYKFSGSQFVPAGGAEPQSPQRMYLHPDSPATGAHWQAQPILFNKVKLTNNTLDNSGQIVLASMHKFQPRIHVIRTADLAQIPWAPQQAFVFPETEFVAVTAYQNDRITKLKIDNNPFAKGFRETGQSRCKRKMSSSPTADDQVPDPHQHQQHPQQQQHQAFQRQPVAMSPMKSAATIGESGSSICSDKPVTAFFNDHIVVDDQADADAPSGRIKRWRAADVAATTSPPLDAACGTRSPGLDYANTSSSSSSNNNNNKASHIFQQQQAAALAAGSRAAAGGVAAQCNASSAAFMHHFQQNMQTLLRPSLVDLACSYFTRPQPLYPHHAVYAVQQQQHEAALLAAGLAPTSGQPLPASAPIPAPPAQPLPPAALMAVAMPPLLPLGGGAELPNRVTAINAHTTSHCPTNDADHSSSDSSLIQDEAAAPTAPAPTTTDAAAAASMPSSADDALPQSPQSGGAGSANGRGPLDASQKRKGFSISAILGGGS